MVLLRVLFLLLIAVCANAQTGFDQKPVKTWFKDTTLQTKPVIVNTQGGLIVGGYNKNADAILEISSTTRGFLLPRMTTSERNAIGVFSEGLTIYNTTTHVENYWNGSAWVAGVGTTGATGSTGVTGATGPTGAAGATGSAGIAVAENGLTLTGSTVEQGGTLIKETIIACGNQPYGVVDNPDAPTTGIFIDPANSEVDILSSNLLFFTANRYYFADATELKVDADSIDFFNFYRFTANGDKVILVGDSAQLYSSEECLVGALDPDVRAKQAYAAFTPSHTRIFSGHEDGDGVMPTVDIGIQTGFYPDAIFGPTIHFDLDKITVYPADTTTPGISLRIVDGTQGTGKVLTSDAIGNATWQSISAALAILPEYADDAAASGGGVPVGGVYYNTTIHAFTKRES